jgi:long-chain acyl-CoA synthetase
MMFSNWYTGISGGGALPSQVDNFFSAAGILVIDGYGLTEAGPFISGRETFNPVSGGVGVPIDNIEIKVVDVEKNDAPVKIGERGVLMVRGPQIMKGYYKKPELTKQIIREGWLDTGDIVIIDRRENISIVGRAKDTIVLLSGENIEPVPIEKKICESPYIDCAVVVGDDCKSLSALIVPDFKNLEEFSKDNNLSEYGRKEPGDIPEISELLFKEVSELVSSKNHFAPFERIYKISILPKSYEVGKELSAKLEPLRPPIYEIYKDEIRELTAK